MELQTKLGKKGESDLLVMLVSVFQKLLGFSGRKSLADNSGQRRIASSSEMKGSSRWATGCGGTGVLHHGCAAHKFAASVKSIWIGFQHLVESMPQKIKADLHVLSQSPSEGYKLFSAQPSLNQSSSLQQRRR